MDRDRQTDAEEPAATTPAPARATQTANQPKNPWYADPDVEAEMPAALTDAV